MMLAPLPRPVTYPRPEPTLAEWRARCLLALSVLGHRLDTTDPDVAQVGAILRGEVEL